MNWKSTTIIILKCHLLLLYATKINHFLIDFDIRGKVDFIWQLVISISVVGLSSSKVLHKAKLAWKKKKVMVTVWWSAAHLFHHSFLYPSKIITSEKYVQQIDEMHWKLQHLQATLVNKKGPVLLYDIAWLHVAQPMLQKLKELGYRILPHLPYSPVLLPNNYHFFKHLDNFLQGKCFHKQQKAENAFQEFLKS